MPKDIIEQIKLHTRETLRINRLLSSANKRLPKQPKVAANKPATDEFANDKPATLGSVDDSAVIKSGIVDFEHIKECQISEIFFPNPSYFELSGFSYIDASLASMMWLHAAQKISIFFYSSRSSWCKNEVILEIMTRLEFNTGNVAEKTGHILCLYHVIRYRGVLPHINRGSSPRINLSRAFSVFVTGNL